MNIHIAIITHQHGNNLYAGVTEADVDKEVQEYVRDNWESHHGKMPKNPAKAVEAYFEAEQDSGSDPCEWLEISEFELTGDIKALAKS